MSNAGEQMPGPRNIGGLTSGEAARRRSTHGPNALPRRRRKTLAHQLAAQLTHTLALLLWVAAGLAVVAGTPALAVAIVVIVVINGLFAFGQEYRADRSAEKLRDLMPARVRVLRDGLALSLDAVELVPGDAVLLQAGDRVGADLRIESSRALRVDESLVTGESVPVPRQPGDPLLTGSFVVQGDAAATVTATGADTALAGISALAAAAERPPSPLTVQLDRVVRIVAVVAVTTGVALGVGSVLLGLSMVDAFLFGVGVTVALVPEGMLPTVTLSLARGAQEMAKRHALVRRLDAVETLGVTSFVCTDKTGTLTQNRMQVVEVVTSAGPVILTGEGYDPVAVLTGTLQARAATEDVARHAAACVTGTIVQQANGSWTAQGDPMEAALACLARRCGLQHIDEEVVTRSPYSPERMASAASFLGGTAVLGAPERVLARCRVVADQFRTALADLTSRGLRVLAVASGPPVTGDGWESAGELRLVGLLALEDPPRTGVREAIGACRSADIRVAMLTGDHPTTARAIAMEVGLLQPGGPVLIGEELPEDDEGLGRLLDRPEGAVVARVTPDAKFRIARALRARGHVVAMTGDGVNDAPALREADVGVAMGASGSDVAREAADMVLLDDHFGTIVTAIELGRATFANVRRFLTYHLTDNVAELTPFAVWALSGGSFPLALGVLQILALDIGTDMLPALGLGTEKPGPRVLTGRPVESLVDRHLLGRAFGVLGATEAVASMAAFAAVLLEGGWRWGQTPSPDLAALASGTAFAVIAVSQMANALACRSTTDPVWRLPLLSNPLVLWAVLAEAVLLTMFLGLPGVSGVLGGGWPSAGGWAMAAGAALLLVMTDAAWKRATSAGGRHHRGQSVGSVTSRAPGTNPAAADR